jgi:hypothetical protein
MTDAPVRELCGPRPADVEEIWIVELRRHATSKEIVKLCELIHQPRTPWSGLNTHRGIVMPLVRVKCFMTRLDEESHIRKLAFYEIGNCSLVHHDPAQIYPIGGNSLQTEILFQLNRIYLPSHSPSGNNIAFLELKCAVRIKVHFIWLVVAVFVNNVLQSAPMIGIVRLALGADD